MNGFKRFLTRGNVVDLAVAVVIGAAFGTVVTAFVKDLITPLIAAAVGKPNFSALAFTINHSRFPIGDFVNAIISFMLVAGAIYYFVILPMAAMTSRFSNPDAAPKLRECQECLSDIPAAATRSEEH